MPQHQPEPLRVAAVGMNDQTINALRLFFTGPCMNRCVLVEEGFAQVTIIDMDAFQAKELWSRHQQLYPNRPVIVQSLREINVEGCSFFVKKPVRFIELWNALEKTKNHLQYAINKPGSILLAAKKNRKLTAEIIGAQMETSQRQPAVVRTISQSKLLLNEKRARLAAKQKKVQSSENAVPVLNESIAAKKVKKVRPKRIIPRYQRQIRLEEDDTNGYLDLPIKPSKSLRASRVCYDPNTYMQGHLQKAFQLAKMNNRDVRIDNLKGHPIILQFKTNELLFEYGEDNLYINSTEPLGEELPEISVVDSKKDNNLPAAGSRQNLEAFLWKLTIRTCRGRVPVGTKFSVPVYLHRWPNMTRLQLIPDAFRIAALWAQVPRSLPATAKTLNIHQEYVFAFYSAAKALGFIGKYTANDFNDQTSGIRNHGNRGILGRILARLRGD